MFNLGLPEILVIGAAALLVFGPKRLPELAKSLGKGIRDFKKALDGEDEVAPPRENLPPAQQQPTIPVQVPTTASHEPVKTAVSSGDSTPKS